MTPAAETGAAVDTPPDGVDEVTLACWQHYHSAKLLALVLPTPMVVSVMVAQYQAFLQAFSGKRVLQ